MTTYFFEYDSEGNIGRIIMYEGETPPTQYPKPGMAFLEITLTGHEDQAARDRLMSARANPARFQVVAGELVER